MAWLETSTGIAVPAPAFGSSQVTISTLVDGDRNTQGNFIGSVIGDDKLKLQMQWDHLTTDQMRSLLSIFDRKQGGHFVNTFKIFDPRVDDYVYMQMYVGDRTGTPFIVNKSTMRPAFWQSVQANLIEV